MKTFYPLMLVVTLCAGGQASASPLDDELGQGNLSKIQIQLDSVLAEAGKLQSLLTERQDEINYLKKTGAYQNFVVDRGSLRLQADKLALAASVKKLRFDRNIPQSCDWRFDSSFKVDVTQPLGAFEQFLEGLPLYPEYSTRDRSITIKPLRIIEDCL